MERFEIEPSLLCEAAKRYIPEQQSANYKTVECHEPLLALVKTTKPCSLIIDPIHQGAQVYVRESIHQRLSLAAQVIQNASQNRFALKVVEGFRCIKVQRELWGAYWSYFKMKYPTMLDKDLWNEVTQYVADPTLCPPHTTGGAVDCTLVDLASGQELEMGSTLNDIGDGTCWTYSADISIHAVNNRRLLLRSMAEAGFCNLASEWWHYSYGDQYHAALLGLSHAVYGPLEFTLTR